MTESGQRRGGLGDRVRDAPVAGGVGGRRAAELARQHLVARLALAERAAQPHGHAGAGTGLDERLGERRPLDERRAGLEAVGAVVAVQDGDRRPGDRALEVGLQQPVRLRLAVGGLDRLAEAAL